jgi:hypothetical protein
MVEECSVEHKNRVARERWRLPPSIRPQKGTPKRERQGGCVQALQRLGGPQRTPKSRHEGACPEPGGFAGPDAALLGVAYLAD